MASQLAKSSKVRALEKTSERSCVVIDAPNRSSSPCASHIDMIADPLQPENIDLEDHEGMPADIAIYTDGHLFEEAIRKEPIANDKALQRFEQTVPNNSSWAETMIDSDTFPLERRAGIHV